MKIQDILRDLKSRWDATAESVVEQQDLALPPLPVVTISAEDAWSHTFSATTLTMSRNIDKHFRSRIVGRQIMSIGGIKDAAIRELKESFRANYDATVSIKIVLPTNNKFEYFNCRLQYSPKDGVIRFNVPGQPLELPQVK